MKYIQRRRKKISSWPKMGSSDIGTMLLTDWRYFLNSLKMAKKRDKYDNDHQINMCHLPLENHGFFMKYIKSKQMLSIPFACETLIVQAQSYFLEWPP